MNAITIPKNLIRNDDLVIIPRKEYEEFLSYKLKIPKEVTITPFQKKIINKETKELPKKNFLLLNEFKSKLGN